MTRSAFLLLFSAVAVLAQPPPPPPPPRGAFAWWDSPIARDLNLTEEQNRQIREVVHSFRNKLIDQRASVEKADGELEDIFDEDRIDQHKANDAVERLASARGELSRLLSQMSLKLRNILTPDQWHELQKRMPKDPGPPGPRLRQVPDR